MSSAPVRPVFSAPALQAVALKPATHVRDRSAPAVVHEGEAGEGPDEEAARRRYFFDTGVGSWYDDELERRGLTFRTIEVPIHRAEARAIVKFFGEHVAAVAAGASTSDAGDERALGGAVDPLTAVSAVEVRGVPESLSALEGRISEAIRDNFASQGAFVKLTTRSPKDAKCALRRAGLEYRGIIAGAADGARRGDVHVAPATAEEANTHVVTLAECASRSLKCTSGAEALALFLDSDRVFEDLKYALEDESAWTVAVSVREWCDAVTLHSEWRGFVWGGKLNALGQYFHPLRFDQLQDDAVVDAVASDCRKLYDDVVAPLIAGRFDKCIVDFAWLGPGKVMLVETNPFDGVLGSFPASTGLFKWGDPTLRTPASDATAAAAAAPASDLDAATRSSAGAAGAGAEDDGVLGAKSDAMSDDRHVLMNGPFEVRRRTEVITLHKLKDTMSPDWRRIVFGA